MTEFREVIPDFSVAAQLSVEDIKRAAENGFKTIVKNRTENEEPGQPSEAEIKAATEAAGMTYRSLPFAGPPPPGVVAEMASLLEETSGPVLAYCRSGRRSITAWALAQALSGVRSPAEIVALAARAGYDLAGARQALETLAPKR
jgi:uncharacterized protein (TIGR01244 family)